jgi:hypothetical protein
MSICNDCYDAGSYVDACASSLSFGTVEVSTEYTIAVQSLSTNKIQSFEVTSSIAGVITIDTVKLSPRTCYDLWVTSGSVNDDRQVISIDSIEYDCITFCTIDTGEGDIAIDLTA